MKEKDVPAFQAELKALLEKYDASIGVDVEGDTHGLQYTFYVGDKGGWNEFPLAETNGIDASDLK